MYFSYGWPKVYAAECGTGDDIIYVTLDSQYLFTVSNVAVQVWSGGQHRVRLGECVRTAEDVQAEGENIAAFWCSAKSTLVVLTSANYIHFYATHVWKESVFPGSSFASNICKVDVYLRSSVKIDSRPKATAVGGDNRFVLVSFEDCTFSTYSWLGKLRETCAPLEGEVYPGVDPVPEVSNEVFDNRQRGSRSIAQFDYADTCKLLAIVLTDGTCAMCQVADSGLHPLAQVAFSHWVCRSFPPAVCVRIGASSQLVAVGRLTGDVALYRLHPSSGSSSSNFNLRNADPPVRILSLEEWGHRVQQTGPVSVVDWSPDCRALAVGYAHQGLVVWSPSGCRLMCTLRQSSAVSTASRLQSSSLVTGESGTNISSLSLPSGEVDFGAVENGTKALAWGPLGYQLVVAEASNTHTIQEIHFAKTLPNHHRVAQSRVSGTSQSGEEIHVLQAHDRLLVITEAVEAQDRHLGLSSNSLEAAAASNDLVVHHIPLPSAYLSANWPVLHAAISPNGLDIAVAGRRGLALYSRSSDRWRLFGDVSQERRIRCQAMSWLDGIIVACSTAEAFEGKGVQSTGPCDLLLFPRYHLDFSSLLCRYSLPQPLVAMDCVGNFVLIASEPLEIALLEVNLKGPLVPSANPKAELVLVREISMLNVGRPLLDMALVPVSSPGSHPSQSVANSVPASPKAALLPPGPVPRGQMPRECVLLRWGGLMSVLDMEKGSEIALSTEIEAFWLSDNLSCRLPTPSAASTAYASRCQSLNPLSPSAIVGSEEELGRLGITDHNCEASTAGHLDVEMPWWAYGSKGMQLWFPSTFNQSLPTLKNAIPPAGTDIELEFDREVYPVGISLADAAIVGITQRVFRGLAAYVPLSPGSSTFYGSSGCGQFPCFYPIPESQPVLPCLLRRLLQRGSIQEALTLAKRHERGPHFTRSLEWLLFTTLELETSKPPQQRKTRRTSSEYGGAPALGRQPSWKGASQAAASQAVCVTPLLSAAADLIRNFPQFADVAVSVARKTDAQLWPALFSAVGTPSSLLESLLDMGALNSAACCLLVIDKMEGATVAHALALRLIKVALRKNQFALCGELLRFIIPPGEADTLYSVRSSRRPSSAMLGSSTSGNLEDGAPTPKSSEGGADLGKGRNGGATNANTTWFGWLFGYGAAARMSNGTTPLPQSSEPEHVSLTTPLIEETSADNPDDAPDNVPDNPDNTPAQEPQTPPHLNLLALKQEAMASAASASRRTADLPFNDPRLAYSVLSRPPRSLGEAVTDSLTPAVSASHVVADHAWQLLEGGKVGALAQLSLAMCFLPGGLANLMLQRQEESVSGTASMSGSDSVSAPDLVSALHIILQDLPIWEGDEVERAAESLMQVYKALDATPWHVALAVLMVDAECALAFRTLHPDVWEEFCTIAKRERRFQSLFKIIDSFSTVPVAPAAAPVM